MASPQSKLTASILIISETASKDPSTDKCIPALSGVFSDLGSSNWTIASTTIIPDSIPAIQAAVLKSCDEGINLIITSGGTGFAIKDVTPEAVGPLIEKQAPGLVHGMLSSSLQVTPFAVMSRPVAGVRGQSLILTLPGSPKGAKENLEAVFKLLSHACLQASGGDSRQMHSGGVKKLEKEAGVGVDGEKSGQKQGQHSHGCGRDHGHGSHQGPKAHTSPENQQQHSNDPSQGPSRRHRHSPYAMLSVTDALQQIEQHTPSPTIITLPVNESLVGHVLAQDVTAAESVPAFRASIVDGYAVIASPDAPSTKGIFPVAMISHAQAGEHAELQHGQVARITTGAPLPPGATSVVMVEDTLLISKTDDGAEEKEIEILTSEISIGENVREVGSDVLAGSTIMRKGEGISAIGGEFGLLASVGVKEVSVYKKPVVGVLSTGDEIVNHTQEGELRRGEVRDTNRPTLLTAIRGSGFEAVDLGIVSDKYASPPFPLFSSSPPFTKTKPTLTPQQQTRSTRTSPQRRKTQSRRNNHLRRRQHGRTRPPKTHFRALVGRNHTLRPRSHETR
jgi:gephyrin